MAGAAAQLAAVLLAVLGICVVLELLHLEKAMAVVLNVFFILPLNALLVSSYYVLAPLRWLYCRWLNKEATHLISLLTMNPTMWDASFDKVIEAVQVGYRAMFLGKDVLELEPLLRVSLPRVDRQTKKLHCRRLRI